MTNILIIEARFYDDIADELVAGATQYLSEQGIVARQKISVPGAFEIPAAIRFAADTGNYDGFIALGCVIRGETSHYDYVCSESARGLNQLALEERLAIGYGILTVENRDQAWERASMQKGNKGAAAAQACVHMLAIKRHFQG